MLASFFMIARVVVGFFVLDPGTVVSIVHFATQSAHLFRAEIAVAAMARTDRFRSSAYTRRNSGTPHQGPIGCPPLLLRLCDSANCR